MNILLSNGKPRIVPLLILLLLCGGGLAAFAISASPAGAAIFSTTTPTQENLWAYAEVAKPAHTPTSTFIPTNTPPPGSTFTPTPGELVMEIVQDTAISASDAQGPSYQPAASYGGSKYILVDISEQHMYVYEGDVLVYSFVASTGINGSTRTGTFQVQSKIPNAYGSTWNIWMPSWLGIYYSHGLENGIHALPILSTGATLWSGYLGRPVSYGCVVLGSYEAQLLYDWAEIGTPVEIRR